MNRVDFGDLIAYHKKGEPIYQYTREDDAVYIIAKGTQDYPYHLWVIDGTDMDEIIASGSFMDCMMALHEIVISYEESKF